MSNEKAKKSNVVIYIEAMGCFIFFIALVAGFLFLAMKTYKIYSSNNEQVMTESHNNKHVQEDVSSKARENDVEEQVEEQKGNDNVYRMFVHVVKNAKTEERVHEIMDKFSRIPLNRYDRERMRKFAELRIEELRK